MTDERRPLPPFWIGPGRTEGNTQIHALVHACGHEGEARFSAYITSKAKQSAATARAAQPCPACAAKRATQSRHIDDDHSARRTNDACG